MLIHDEEKVLEIKMIEKMVFVGKVISLNVTQQIKIFS